MANGITLMNSGTVEKSVDGTGAIQRGTFTFNGTVYENATLTGGAVYDSSGNYIATVTEGVWAS